MSEAEFLAARNVSRETLQQLRAYDALLRRWNGAINLVSKSTLDAVWSRHFLDSAQLFALASEGAQIWVDLGSGGGFPGMIAAILSADAGRKTQFTLVESDVRKAAFLATVSRDLGLGVRVLSERVEALAPLRADILSARALAPLDKLIEYAKRHLAPDGVALFPKGASHADELKQALDGHHFSYLTAKSLTDPDAVIYQIRGAPLD